MDDRFDVGFSGTREGMTLAQIVEVKFLLRIFRVGNPIKSLWFHHGLCIGADEEAHNLAYSARYAIHIHPPNDPKLISTRTMIFAAYSEPLPYIERNKVIVDSSDVVIATPNSKVEQFRGSGTWATIRYAKLQEKKLYIIFPDGTREKHVY